MSQAAAEAPLWRSQIIVPVNVEKYVAKAHTRGADCVILDLEDSITPPEKEAARGLIASDAARRAAAGGRRHPGPDQPAACSWRCAISRRW